MTLLTKGIHKYYKLQNFHYEKKSNSNKIEKSELKQKNSKAQK